MRNMAVFSAALVCCFILSAGSLWAQATKPPKPGGETEPVCKACSGTRKIPCPCCAGKGKITEPCMKCSVMGGKSAGKLPCTNCNAQGFVTCKKCNGSGMVSEAGRKDPIGCTACGGAPSSKSHGRGTVPCPKCRGGYNVCPECKGKATVDIPCQFCEGKGKIDCDVCVEKKDSPDLQKMKTDRAGNIKSLEGTTASALIPYRLYDPPVFTQREDGFVVSFRYGIEVYPGGLAKESLTESMRVILCALPRDGWLDVVKYVRFTCIKLKLEQDGTPKDDGPLMIVTWKSEDLKKLDWNTNPAAADWLKAAFKKLLHPCVK